MGRVVGRTRGLRGIAGDRRGGFGVGGRERVGARTQRGAAGGPGGGEGGLAAAIREERRERR